MKPLINNLRQFHLLGAIGSFLSLFAAIISLAASPYSIEETSILVIILDGCGCGLVVWFCLGTFRVAHDRLVKTGCLIAGIGLLWNVVMSCFLTSGINVAAFTLIGGLVVLAGETIACISYLMLFKKDPLVLVFCVFVFAGLVLSLLISLGGVIANAGLGGLLLYFYFHNVTY